MTSDSSHDPKWYERAVVVIGIAAAVFLLAIIVLIPFPDWLSGKEWLRGNAPNSALRTAAWNALFAAGASVVAIKTWRQAVSTRNLTQATSARNDQIEQRNADDRTQAANDRFLQAVENLESGSLPVRYAAVLMLVNLASTSAFETDPKRIGSVLAWFVRFGETSDTAGHSDEVGEEAPTEGESAVAGDASQDVNRPERVVPCDMAVESAANALLGDPGRFGYPVLDGANLAGARLHAAGQHDSRSRFSLRDCDLREATLVGNYSHADFQGSQFASVTLQDFEAHSASFHETTGATNVVIRETIIQNPTPDQPGWEAIVVDESCLPDEFVSEPPAQRAKPPVRRA